MEDEIVSAETETAVDSQPQEQQTVEDASQDDSVATEPVDEIGVPLRNREAEAHRKALKALQSQPETNVSSEDEAIKIVEGIALKKAQEQVAKSIEPLLVKQFLMENPDASEMVDDIIRIRQQYPELAGVDKLDLAYRIARSDRQDALVAKKLEQGLLEKQQIKEKSSQAGVEGAGSSKSVGNSLIDKINGANTLAELQALEKSITG